MIVIKDSMVLIHLAKISLLEKACNFFKKVFIPEKVYHEILAGKKKNFPDIPIITELMKKNKIITKKIKNKNFIKKIHQFNIQGGEAEVIALYWEKKANFIATDDDNVRKKKALLNIKIIGTPTIILNLYHKKNINKQKAKQSIFELKKIGWFTNAIIDKMLSEVEK